MSVPTHYKSTLDALPKPFVSAMRTLFDLMDDRRTGYVRFSDIEQRWQENRSIAHDLPIGLIDSLRKVTPASGLLTFERFCAGLRICLLRHNPSKRHESQQTDSCLVSRPASVPLPDRGHGGISLPKQNSQLEKVLHSSSTEKLPLSVLSSTQSRMTRHNTATVRPTNVSFVQQRAISMPHLQNGIKPYQQLSPKREEPQALPSRKHPQQLLGPQSAPLDKNQVTLALEKWREMKTYGISTKPDNQTDAMHHPSREIAHRNNTSHEIAPFNNLNGPPVSFNNIDTSTSLKMQELGPSAKKAIRRKEPRRHTVTNGIDYNMIKRLKLLEQEKDFLLQGLDVVERARTWYVQQISDINDKLDRVSKWDNSHSEYSMDALHERLNFQMARIFEVNQHLNALMETSEKGFPIHMNLALHHRNIYGEQKVAAQTIQRLKNQNHALTEEIGKKSEIITQLESEKSALIRELFHARTNPKKDSSDTTLW